MGEKIGAPLTVETGKPRVLPKMLPTPQPEKVPEEVPGKVPVHVQAIRQVVAERAYQDTTVAIQRTAKFLGISEQRVADIVVTFLDRITRVLRYVGERARASRALQSHQEMITRMDEEGWKNLGPHERPQLESEPDD